MKNGNGMPKKRGYKEVTKEEVVASRFLQKAGKSPRQIGRALGRTKSTIENVLERVSQGKDVAGLSKEEIEARVEEAGARAMQNWSEAAGLAGDIIVVELTRYKEKQKTADGPILPPSALRDVATVGAKSMESLESYQRLESKRNQGRFTGSTVRELKERLRANLERLEREYPDGAEDAEAVPSVKVEEREKEGNRDQRTGKEKGEREGDGVPAARADVVAYPIMPITESPERVVASWKAAADLAGLEQAARRDAREVRAPSERPTNAEDVF